MNPFLRPLSLILLAAIATLPLAAQSARILRIDIDRAIHPLTAELVRDGIEQAKTDGAAAVLIRLNTPGGLLSATEEIIQSILSAPMPVVAYVSPSGGKAASAGFLILVSADVAAMAPGTNTGAAHPVLLGGGEMDEIMKQKVESDASASIRAVTDKRGRNSELAEEAVRESRAFTDQEALDQNLIDLIASSESDLVKQLDGREVLRFDETKTTLDLAGAQVYPQELTYRQKMLLPLVDPSLAFILLVLGLLGVYIEFSNPGLVFPGVLGGLMVIVGMMALSLLPINWAGAALIVFGIVCLVLEAFVVSHGVLAAGGIVAMTLGAVMLIDTELPELSIGWTTALAVTIPFAVITVFLLQLAIRSFRLKVATGSEGMAGEIGVAKTAVSDAGQVFVHGELWSAWAERPIERGKKIRVVAVDGLRAKVEPID